MQRRTPGFDLTAASTVGAPAPVAEKSRRSTAEETLRALLAAADIAVGGTRPWDIRVHDARFYSRVMAHGTLGLGESYMEGWWDCDALDEMCCRAIRADVEGRMPRTFKAAVSLAGSHLLNLQTRRRARRVGEVHYDLGNDFFEAMLGPSMQYSCAYFRNTDDLSEAQRLKLDLICRKLGLRAGMRLLDIGCGWGGLARHAAGQYGCEVVGVTISREQQSYAESACRGLPAEIRLQDYRDVRGKFDRIASVGMLEHVGHKNYRAYFETARRCLAANGAFLCHTIGGNLSKTDTEPWVRRYIFPNSMIPSAAQITRASEGLLVLEDLENFGGDYDRTLLAWEKNFAGTWGRFSARYGEKFRRMWRFYLLSCAGAFRARSLQLFQFLFSNGGMEQRPVR